MSAVAEYGHRLLPHPPYSPDLAPSDLYFFPVLKQCLQGTLLLCDNDVTESAEDFLQGQEL